MWAPTEYNYFPKMPFEVASYVRDTIFNDSLKIEQTFYFGSWKHLSLNFFCANFTDPDNLIMRERATQSEAAFACKGWFLTLTDQGFSIYVEKAFCPAHDPLELFSMLTTTLCAQNGSINILLS